MCGILARYNANGTGTSSDFDALLIKLWNRGPDGFGTYHNLGISLGHRRLCVHPSTTKQPLEHKGWRLIVNGEFYSCSRDCLYLLDNLETLPLSLMHVDAVYAFVAWHPVHGIRVGRDRVGVCPLYVGATEDNLWFASELKALKHCDWCSMFPPNTIYDGRDWMRIPSAPRGFRRVRNLLKGAVQRRLNMDVPWGVFLSGGLDSSIIASLAKQCIRPKGYPMLHTFSIGLHDSPDIGHAREVANYIGSVHHEVIFTIEEGLNCIPAVIRAIETYDTTTVRASVPMWLLAREVKRSGIKVMLSGEGADELFAGYAYNKYAPNPEALQRESERKIHKLHAYDCLRANKCCAAWGVECRVPFLSDEMVHHSRTMDPFLKMWDTMEKEYLRTEFEQDLCNCGVLWRKKAQFSDAVGSRWIEACRAIPGGETNYYKSIFDSLYPDRENCCLHEKSVACSTATAADWVTGARLDPSGEIEISL